MLSLKVIVCFMLVGCHAPSLGKWQIAQLASGQLDAVTTYYVNTSYTGMGEMNPIYRPFASHAVTALPAMAIADYMAIKIEQRVAVHHRKWARVLGIAVIGSHMVCGALNIRLAESLPASQRR